MIDTHCHLTFPDFSSRVRETLDDAARAGVTGCITISTTTHDCLDALAIAKAYENVWCSAGVHPLYSDPTDERASGRSGGGTHNWANVRLVASDPKCVAWGELGLDNHYPTPLKSVQRQVLDEQLAFIRACHESGVAAARGGLPVVIHCREAFDDLIPVLKASTLDPARFVFHCFTGTPREARMVLDFGACLSFTGVVTYANAKDTHEAAKLVPIDRIMVETDAPFLPPRQHRGKRPCMPGWVRHTAEAIAELRGMPFEDFHRHINQNTQRFFGIPCA